MQKQITSVLLFALVALFNLSCQNNALEPAEQTNEKFISFQGEKVRIPADFPEELFGQTQEEFDAYITGKSNANARAVSRTMLTYTEIGEILSRNLAKYPRVNYDSISNEDLKRILIDIPSVRNMEDALSKVEIIFDYYNTLAKSDIIPEVLSLEERKVGAKIAGPTPGSLTVPERNVLLGNPGYGQHYVAAAQEANFLTPSIWGLEEDGKKNNAFKHSLWNCLIIRYIITGTPASKNSAINFAQNGTSAHEKDDDGNQIHDYHAAMDLHNNQAARNWMDDEVKWGIGPLRKMPSVEKIIDTWYNRANSASFYNGANGDWVGILNLHGGNNSTTWNNLYNNLYGGHQHNVYIF